MEKVVFGMPEKHLQFFLVTWVLFILFLCGASIVNDSQRSVSNLWSECRWTDSSYLKVDGNKVFVLENAPLSQWPFGHDVRVYADWNGKLQITYYPPAIIYEM